MEQNNIYFENAKKNTAKKTTSQLKICDLRVAGNYNVNIKALPFLFFNIPS